MFFFNHKNIQFQVTSFELGSAIDLNCGQNGEPSVFSAEKDFQNDARPERGDQMLAGLQELEGCLRGDDQAGDDVPVPARAAHSAKPPAVPRE